MSYFARHWRKYGKKLHYSCNIFEKLYYLPHIIFRKALINKPWRDQLFITRIIRPTKSSRNFTTNYARQERRCSACANMLKNEISDYESETLIIDCPNIILEPVTGNVLKRINGPGSIIQKAGGGFLLKMFIAEGVDIKSSFERINRLQSGKLIGSSEYYRMTATDFKDRNWICKNLYPNFSGSLSQAIITSDLFEIAKVESLPKKNLNTLKIKFRGNFEIPVNAVTNVKKLVDGVLGDEETRRNVCKFSSCKMEIEIIKDDEWIIVYASSEKNEFDESIVCRIIEALQLCMGRQLKWSFITEIRNQNKKDIMRGIILNDNKGRSYRPVDYDNNVKDAICLMDCYLEKTIKSKDTTVHPLFHPLYSVILASKSTTETEALTLATSVESLVKIVTKNIDKDEETKKSIDKLKKHVNSRQSYPDKFKKRINGLLGMMQSPSAVEKLNSLVKQGVLRKELVGTWKKLRPKVAHGNFSVDDFQGFLDMVHTVHVLVHHLLFYYIGYSGQYIDYSAKGWPSQKYNNGENNELINS